MRQLNLVTRVTSLQLWRGSKTLVLVGVLGILLATQTVHAASVFYDFVQDGTDVVLAQIELGGDEPWDHADVLRLTITAAGDAALSLGEGLYGGTFDETEREFKMDLAGDGLIGIVGFNGSMIDNNPPDGASTLTLFAGTEGNPDRIFATGPARTGVGDWKFNPVPEPGSLGLAVVAMVGVGCVRRLRHG